MKYKKIINRISKAQHILVTTHINPDPDGLCSQIAMGLYLKSLGKKFVLMNHEKPPHRYYFLDGVKKIKAFNEKRKPFYDCVIVLDCGDLSRTGRVRHVLSDKSFVINIDHHVTNEMFGDLNCVLPEASSTVEVMYHFLKRAKFSFNKKLAKLIYTGMVADTGSFRYENTSSLSHRIAAELMDFGISSEEVFKYLYGNIPLQDVQLFTRLVSRFQIEANGKIITLSLRNAMVKKFSEEFDLRDAIFKFIRSIAGVELIVIFTEQAAHKTRVNFRSLGKVDVAQLANEFHGGGHRKASGCMLDKNLSQTRDVILHRLKGIV